MTDFDDVTDEELRLAAELATQLEGNGPLHDLPEDLRSPISLLTNIDSFELSPEAHLRGRAEIEKRVAADAKGPSLPSVGPAWPKWRLLYWLPLPTAAVLVLVFLTFGPSERHETSKPASEAGFSPLPPRYHVGETPSALLSAQAAVLAERTPGQQREKARAEFERQMRAYRGQLIASLEVGGR